MFKFWFTLALPCAVTVAVTLVSCSSGPARPEPGTAAFYWGAANETWKAGNYTTTLENLGHLSDSENEFLAKAQPWILVSAGGLAHGYLELADAYEDAARATKGSTAPLRSKAITYRAAANTAALQLAETHQKFAASAKGQAVAVTFLWPPAGTAAKPVQFPRFIKGMTLTPGDEEQLERGMLQRDVLLAAAAVAGAGDDAAKGRASFETANPSLPAEAFEIGMAHVMFDVSTLYDSKRLDRPDRRDLLLNQALAALKPYTANKEAKDLTAKIQKELKKRT